MTATSTPIEGGTLELAAEIGDGFTYRMLNYWCRKGWITLADNGHGSGTRRHVTPTEAAAIRELVDIYRDALVTLEHIKTGEMFAIILACQEADDV